MTDNGTLTITNTDIEHALARAARGQADPPEALVRVAALVGGWPRKQARRRVRRVWPEVRRELAHLAEDLELGSYLDYLDSRKAGAEGGAADDLTQS